MLIPILLLLGTLVKGSRALWTNTCDRAQFQLASGWQIKHTVKSLTIPDIQTCITVCMDHPFCEAVGYDFNLMKCTMAAKSTVPGSCDGPNLISVDTDVYTYLTSSMQVTLNCFSCTDDQAQPTWTQITTPPNTPAPEVSLLTSDDKTNLQKNYATPQCVFLNMTAVHVTTSQIAGRWWGVAAAGIAQEHTTSSLMDFFPQDDPTLLILREVANVGGQCTETYMSYQDDTLSNGQHVWERTSNYTVDQRVLRYAELGRTTSLFRKVLFANTNLIVEYQCVAPNLNGTCGKGNEFMFISTRTQATISDGDLAALNVLLSYTCMSQYGYTFKKQNPLDSCVNAYLNRTSIYYTRSGCDYTNTTWIKEHSTVTTYSSLVENPNWQSIDGQWFGQVTTLNYSAPPGQLYTVMYRQQTNNTASCSEVITLASTINNTAQLAKEVPGWFATENLWALAFNLTNPKTANVTAPTTSKFWRIADDGIVTATMGGLGLTPPHNASQAGAAGSRRYRKQSLFYFRVRLYPTYALACINVQALVKNVQSVRLPTLNCGQFADPKTCLVSDIASGIYQGSPWQMPTEGGTWVLALTSMVKKFTALGCTYGPNPGKNFFNCYYTLNGQCFGPWNTSLWDNKPMGNFTWAYEDPSRGSVQENLIVVYFTKNIVATYGCRENGVDQDGSCRDDRMLAYVFIKSTYTLTADDLTAVQAAFDKVCLFTPSQLFPLNTNDPCLKPILGN